MNRPAALRISDYPQPEYLYSRLRQGFGGQASTRLHQAGLYFSTSTCTSPASTPLPACTKQASTPLHQPSLYPPAPARPLLFYFHLHQPSLYSSTCLHQASLYSKTSTIYLFFFPFSTIR